MNDSDLLRYRHKISFYRDQFYKGFRRLIILYILIFLLIAVVFYQRVTQPELIFFAVTPGGNIHQMDGYSYRELSKVIDHG